MGVRPMDQGTRTEFIGHEHRLHYRSKLITLYDSLRLCSTHFSADLKGESS